MRLINQWFFPCVFVRPGSGSPPVPGSAYTAGSACGACSSFPGSVILLDAPRIVSRSLPLGSFSWQQAPAPWGTAQPLPGTAQKRTGSHRTAAGDHKDPHNNAREPQKSPREPHESSRGLHTYSTVRICTRAAGNCKKNSRGNIPGPGSGKQKEQGVFPALAIRTRSCPAHTGLSDYLRSFRGSPPLSWGAQCRTRKSYSGHCIE